MPVFNSRNPIYRNPTGAVAENTRVHFKIYAHAGRYR